MMATPETLRALLVANAATSSKQEQSPRADLPMRTKHLCGKMNLHLYKHANEPSVAGYRIQEHVYKTVPQMIKDRPSIEQTTTQLNGVLYDLDYTTNFLDELDDSIQNSIRARERISELASKMSAASARANRPSPSSH